MTLWEFWKVDVRDERDAEKTAAMSAADGWTVVSVRDEEDRLVMKRPRKKGQKAPASLPTTTRKRVVRQKRNIHAAGGTKSSFDSMEQRDKDKANSSWFNW